MPSDDNHEISRPSKQNLNKALKSLESEWSKTAAPPGLRESLKEVLLTLSMGAKPLSQSFDDTYRIETSHAKGLPASFELSLAFLDKMEALVHTYTGPLLIRNIERHIKNYEIALNNDSMREELENASGLGDFLAPEKLRGRANAWVTILIHKQLRAKLFLELRELMVAELLPKMDELTTRICNQFDSIKRFKVVHGIEFDLYSVKFPLDPVEKDCHRGQLNITDTCVKLDQLCMVDIPMLVLTLTVGEINKFGHESFMDSKIEESLANLKYIGVDTSVSPAEGFKSPKVTENMEKISKEIEARHGVHNPTAFFEELFETKIESLIERLIESGLVERRSSKDD